MSALQMEAEKERGKLDMAPGFLAVPIVYDKSSYESDTRFDPSNCPDEGNSQGAHLKPGQSGQPLNLDSLL